MLGRVDVLKYIGKTILGFHKKPLQAQLKSLLKVKNLFDLNGVKTAIKIQTLLAAQELEDLQSTI